MGGRSRRLHRHGGASFGGTLAHGGRRRLALRLRVCGLDRPGASGKRLCLGADAPLCDGRGREWPCPLHAPSGGLLIQVVSGSHGHNADRPRRADTHCPAANSRHFAECYPASARRNTLYFGRSSCRGKPTQSRQQRCWIFKPICAPCAAALWCTSAADAPSWNEMVTH